METKIKKAKTATVKIPETFIYEMMDSDGEAMGLLKTNLPLNKVEKEWKKYYNNLNNNDDYIGLHPFINIMQKKHKASLFTFERVFCEATIYP
jgi:hypothetical protein